MGWVGGVWWKEGWGVGERRGGGGGGERISHLLNPGSRPWQHLQTRRHSIPHAARH